MDDSEYYGFLAALCLVIAGTGIILFRPEVEKDGVFYIGMGLSILGLSKINWGLVHSIRKIFW